MPKRLGLSLVLLLGLVATAQAIMNIGPGLDALMKLGQRVPAR